MYEDNRQISIDMTLAMALVVPLGYYVPWMNWLAWIVVCFTLAVQFIATLVVIHIMAKDPNRDPLPWKLKSFLPLAVAAWIMLFDWPTASGIMVGSWIGFNLAIRIIPWQVKRGG